jgi:hypothetical protein
MKKKPFLPCLQQEGHGMLMKLFCSVCWPEQSESVPSLK